MRFTRKNQKQASPILISSAVLSATFDDDFFHISSSTAAENNTQNVFYSSPFHTPPSSPVPSGDSSYKTNLQSSHNEERTAIADTIEPGLRAPYLQPDWSPVTCLPAANRSGREDTWTGDDNEINPVLSTAAGVGMPSDGQVHHISAVPRPTCVCMVESPAKERMVTEPYMEAAEEHRRAIQVMKRYKSSPALDKIRGISSQGLQTNRNCNHRQSLLRFWTRFSGQEQNPNFKTSQSKTPHPTGLWRRESRDGIESDMSPLHVRDNDGRGDIRDDDESISGKTFAVRNGGKKETTATHGTQFHSHCIDDPKPSTASSRNTGSESAGEPISRSRHHTSILGRLSERNPFSKRSGIAPRGDEQETKNGPSMSPHLDPRSQRLMRGRSAWLMTFLNKLRDRTPDGYFKAGVFDFDCGGQVALNDLKALFERHYHGVLISEQFLEMRMRVSLTTAGRFCILDLIAVAEPRSGGNSRVYLRRWFVDVLAVRSEDFDWFCFDVYRTLIRYRAVLRPYYA